MTTNLLIGGSEYVGAFTHYYFGFQLLIFCHYGSVRHIWGWLGRINQLRRLNNDVLSIQSLVGTSWMVSVGFKVLIQLNTTNLLKLDTWQLSEVLVWKIFHLGCAFVINTGITVSGCSCCTQIISIRLIPKAHINGINSIHVHRTCKIYFLRDLHSTLIIKPHLADTVNQLWLLVNCLASCKDRCHFWYLVTICESHAWS